MEKKEVETDFSYFEMRERSIHSLQRGCTQRINLFRCLPLIPVWQPLILGQYSAGLFCANHTCIIMHRQMSNFHGSK